MQLDRNSMLNKDPKALWEWNTNIVVTTRRDGLVVAQERLHNVITRNGLTLARDSLRGTDTMKILQIGIGANGDAVSEEDTDLGDERLRVTVLRRATLGFAAIITTAYIAPGEANDFTINEIGWWASDATSTLGTGTLLSRVLFNKTKNSLESIQIDRTDTFAEAP